MTKIYGLVLLFILSICVSCQEDLEAPEPRSGNLEFNKFIAIGDGYTAGFQDQGLFERGQSVSFPWLIAQQLRMISPIGFTQPIAPGNGSGYLNITNLNPTTCPQVVTQAVLEKNESSPLWDDNIANKGPFSNLGIPLLRSSEIDSPEALKTNPFLSRISGDATRSYLDLVVEQTPDLLTVWLGNFDMLEYAQSGGDSYQDLPDAGRFEKHLISLLDTILYNSAQGSILIGTIPDITLLPYFTAVPKVFTDTANCATGNRPIYIEAKTSPDATATRAATVNDYILLPADSLIRRSYAEGINLGLDPLNPLAEEYVLDEWEADQLKNQISRYNEVIARLINDFNLRSGRKQLVSVDLNRLFSEIHEGVIEDGLELSTEYLTGGMISTDGLYLTPRGNAIIANAFIEVANTTFQSSIPTLNISDYSGVLFP